MSSAEGYGEVSVREAGASGTGSNGGYPDRRITPADVEGVRFTRGARMHPGYVESEVDAFLDRVSDEIRRLVAEKAELRDEVNALRQQVSGVTTPEPPSDQAVRILAVAQQTADDYVAEAESFSRIATQEAREHYEEQLRLARDKAGAIIQAAQEAAESIAASGAPVAGLTGSELPDEQLQEQVRYLQAFAQAVRVQLRAYLEALLTDVEAEWGRADPSALARTAIRTPAQRPGIEGVRNAYDHEPNVAQVLNDHRVPQEPRGARG
jgi:DivIVA domain-containing protein